MPVVNYFIEDIHFSLKNKKKISNWISSTVSMESKKLSEVNFIFCSDSYLLEINQTYLNHNTYTDIITFDNSETDEEIEGDIYISIERIKDNMSKFNETFEKELHRVIIHGILHLIGYKDKSTEDKKRMREREDHYLNMLIL
jgi:probable rRNA maturation factor